MDSKKEPSSAAPEPSQQDAPKDDETQAAENISAAPSELSADSSAEVGERSSESDRGAHAEDNPEQGEGAKVENTEEGTPSAPAANAAEAEKGVLAGLSKTSLIALALFIAVIAFAVYRIYSFSLSSAPAQVTAGAQLDLPEVVARVNGVEITREELLRQLAQTKAFLASVSPQGAPQDEKALRDAVVTDLINGELLFQAASASGVSVTDDEVSQEFENAKASMASEEAFQSQLSSLGHTEETFRVSLRRQMTVNKYLTDKVQFNDITVPEEESRALYQQFFAQNEGNGDVPPFEKVQPQIENELRNQKARAKVQGIIDDLRQDAEIEKLL